MNCCANCFKDIELKGFINNNSNAIGDCDYCNTKNTQIIDPTELQDQFADLCDLYQIEQNDGTDFFDLIQKDWNIFNVEGIDQETSRELLYNIFDGLDTIYIDIVNSNVVMATSEETKELIYQWEVFKDEIKYKNRFFPENKIDFEYLEDVFPRRYYDRGKNFYRSRISPTIDGYEPKNMGKPPRQFTSSGRANPKGISYLYLAQSKETTFYEARSTFLDYVSIGKFKLLEKVQLVTLRPSHQTSPFSENFNVKKFVKYKEVLELFEKELSKPLRRQDDDLDYLPTQYLCEFIKSLGYKGVEYGSSLHDGGINFVFFDDTVFSCVSSKVYEVSKIKMEYKEVN
ncbi:RES domain-containing protein [Tenacibaculum sp. 190524A02b]|uniref:RES domain-containing protein n=1 Tax=Tenacibaculum vairaonense TaxID=3137860 RepID=UPI0031FAD76C